MTLAVAGFLVGAIPMYFILRRRRDKANITTDKTKSQENISDKVEPEVVDMYKYGAVPDAKMVLCLRKDLKLTLTEISTASARIVLDLQDESMSKCPSLFKNWKKYMQVKICCAVKSEDELLSIKNNAEQLKIPFATFSSENYIKDGRQQFIGLGIFGTLNQCTDLTGQLKLFN
ncbi:MAG: hypothetical protein EZS28_033652 [Streblomastix strix]|uniref:peptidyl-tRNA hydrolase n=1 Tax=Streblomastix strix TaxID=222440 RepID=A0A5J4ULA9_9EUKA|nr:MAG: hypothetical protein EZS28_033652 [Streblomastix strix]